MRRVGVEWASRHSQRLPLDGRGVLAQPQHTAPAAMVALMKVDLEGMGMKVRCRSPRRAGTLCPVPRPRRSLLGAPSARLTVDGD